MVRWLVGWLVGWSIDGSVHLSVSWSVALRRGHGRGKTRNEGRPMLLISPDPLQCEPYILLKMGTARVWHAMPARFH